MIVIILVAEITVQTDQSEYNKFDIFLNLKEIFSLTSVILSQ